MTAFGSISESSVGEGVVSSDVEIFLPTIYFDLSVDGLFPLPDVAINLPLIEFNLSTPLPTIAPDAWLRLPVIDFVLSAAAPKILPQTIVRLPVINFNLSTPAQRFAAGYTAHLPTVTFDLVAWSPKPAGVDINLPRIEFRLTTPGVKLQEGATIDLDGTRRRSTGLSIAEGAIADRGRDIITRNPIPEFTLVVFPPRIAVDAVVRLPVVEFNLSVEDILAYDREDKSTLRVLAN